MRAAVLNEYNTPLVIEELDDPPLGLRDVRVQIDASGVCHSDLTVQKGGVPMPVPIVLGHEGAGTVLEVGKEVIAYRTPEECAELIQYYLEHDDKREAIARAGQQRTLRNHTYYQRMQELVNIVRKYM